jgi:hypothetical protein
MTHTADDLSAVTSPTAATANTNTDQGLPFTWMGVQATQMAQNTRTNMKDWILLDSQSSVDLFCNPALVQNITGVDETLVLSTNAGDLITDQKADVPDYGQVWYDKNAMTNVFSLAEMEKHHRVTYESQKESAFIVHTPRGPTKFTKGPENLYYYKPKYRTGTTMVETVSDNEAYYTDRQIARAKEARKLLHALGCPTVQDLKSIIRMNTIANCPITIGDIDLADKIYGKDIASLKGKTTRQKPEPVVQNLVEIPSELKEAQHDVDLCVDTMFVNELPFLTTISKRIMYRTPSWIPTQTMRDYKTALIDVI